MDAASPTNPSDFITTNQIVNSPAMATKPKSKIIYIIVTIVSLIILVILGTLTFAIMSTETTPKNPATESGLQTPAPAVFTLTVSGVANNDVVTTKNLKLTGSTGTKAQVAITGGEDDSVLESAGTFNTTVALKIGVNQLSVTAEDDQGNQKQQSIVVFYQEIK